MNDPFVLAGREYRSRLIVGTGKYKGFEETRRAIEASGAEIVTVAVRRVNITDRGQENLLDYLDPKVYTILPNTAGCYTVEDALRVARLGRELTGSAWVKLEVIADQKYLLPDPVGTFEAARILIDEGFVVLPYINDDPALARRLQEIGTATVMPLASPIGSGQGMPYFGQIRIIVDEATVPVVIDAGLAVPSEAALAMELGADACLVNTAIALAQKPAEMAEAFRLGVDAGRMAFLAGRIPRKAYASASSPTEGQIE
jgi:thiazole synthase